MSMHMSMICVEGYVPVSEFSEYSTICLARIGIGATEILTMAAMLNEDHQSSVRVDPSGETGRTWQLGWRA